MLIFLLNQTNLKMLNVKQRTEYNKARTREQIEKIHKEIVNKVTKNSQIII